MADLRKETHGPGSMKGVNLMVIAYDNRFSEDKEGNKATAYLDLRIHPDDRRAPGQVMLALNAKKDPKASSGYNNSAAYSMSQFRAIVDAAGDNKVNLTNTAEEVVGTIYGIKADLLINGRKEVLANTKTLETTEMSVLDTPDGRSIRTRGFDSMKEATAARAAAKPAKGAEAPAGDAPATNVPTAETPPVDFAALQAAADAANAALLAATPKAATPVVEAKAAAPKAKATRKPRVAKPEVAIANDGVESGQTASDEPELG